MKHPKPFVLLWLALALLLTPATALADYGPHGRATVVFHGLEQEEYWATLLSTQDIFPNGYIYQDGGTKKIDEADSSGQVWEKFQAYQDLDGYQFLQFYEDCSDSDSLEWSYYPPPNFKILLYLPEKDSYVLCGDTYSSVLLGCTYSVTVNTRAIKPHTTVTNATVVTRQYDSLWQGLRFAFRCFVTILLELWVAAQFGYTLFHQRRVIVRTNIATQLALNILLNFAFSRLNFLMFLALYALLECGIVAVEAWVYQRRFDPAQRNREEVDAEQYAAWEKAQDEAWRRACQPHSGENWLTYERRLEEHRRQREQERQHWEEGRQQRLEQERAMRKPTWYAAMYSLAANLLSFGTGLFLSSLVPGVF